MGGDRKAWAWAALLIAVGAGFDAIAVALYWQPCAGNLLSGSIFNGYRYGAAFSQQCMVAMDQAAVFPLPQAGLGWTVVGGLGAVAAVLLAASWLVVVGALRVPRVHKLVAVLPAVFTVAVVAQASVVAFGPAPTEDPLALTLSLLLELSVPVALVALSAAGVHGLLLVRTAIVAVAASSVGIVHQLFEYATVVLLSDANWDFPPGTGWGTVILAMLAAIATRGLSARRTGDNVVVAVPRADGSQLSA
jgi:hypothetical protein